MCIDKDIPFDIKLTAICAWKKLFFIKNSKNKSIFIPLSHNLFMSEKNPNEEYFQSLLESLNKDPNWRVVEEQLEKYELIKKDLTPDQQAIISEMGRAMLALADSQPKIIIDKFLELAQNLNKK